MPTTLTVDPAVRQRLKTFGTHGMTYNEILTRLMDQAEKTRFLDSMYRELRETPRDAWVSLDDLDEDFLPQAAAQRGRRSPGAAPRASARAPKRAASPPKRSRSSPRP